MKSVLLIGLGRFGRHMAQKLQELHHEVLAVDKEEQRVNDALPYVTNAQIGDATNEAFIASLGVRNFDLCVVAIGDNFQSALETTVLLKDYGATFILARASRDVHRKLLMRNGADQVVYAEKEMAERLAVKYGAKNIFDYVELTDEVSIYEIAVPAQWCGKSILENAIRTKYQLSILATKKNGKINPLPEPKHILTSEETLMVMGSYQKVKAVTK